MISAKKHHIHRTLFVLILLASLLASAPVQASPISETEASEDWPMYQHDARHSGRTASTIANSNPLYLQWAYSFGERVEVEVQPVVAGNVIYVGVMNGDMHAINATTGAKIWTTRPGGPIAHTAAVSGGRVIFGSLDGYVYALNSSNGSLAWKFKTNGPVMSAPAVVDGRVLIGSNDGNLYAIHATTGAQAWKVTTGGPVVTSPAVANGRIYFGSEDMHARAVNASSGSVIWSKKLTGAGMHNMHPVVSDDGNVVIFLTVKPGGNAYVPVEDYPGVSSSANPVSTWNSFYQEHPERRYLFYLNASNGNDLWNPAQQRYVPMPLPYWGLIHPILGSDGYAWFPAPSGAAGANFALDHDNRLFKVNLSTGAATQVAGAGSAHEFQIIMAEVGRHAFAGGDYYYTISEDLAVYRPGNGNLRALFSNGSATSYNFGTHMDPLSPLPSRHLWRYGGAVSMGGVPGASQPILANNMVYYVSYGWLYAVGTTNRGLNPATSFPSRDTRQHELTYPRAGALTRAQIQSEAERRVADIIALGPDHYPITARWEQTDKGMAHNEFRFEVYGFEADTIRVLSEAYPYLPAAQQSQLKTYLTELANDTILNPAHYAYSTSCVIQGTAGVQTSNNCRDNTQISAYWWNNNPNLVAQRLYAIWAYANATGQWADVQAKWNSLIKPEFQKFVNAYDANLGFCRFDEWLVGRLNIGAQIVMAQGVRDLAAHFNDTATRNSAQTLLTNLLNGRVRLADFVPMLYDSGRRKPAPIRLRADGTINNDDIMVNGPYNGDMIPYNAALRDRNTDVSQVNWLAGSFNNPSSYRVDAGMEFMHYPALSGYFPLSSEFSARLRSSLLAKTREYVKSYEVNHPWWWLGDLAHHTTGSGEHLYHSPTLAWTMFQVKARVLQESWDALARQLPEAASFNSRYDLYRLQNLVTLLGLPGGGQPAGPDLSDSRMNAAPAAGKTGDEIRYTITIRNTGGSLSSTLNLSNVLPAGLAYVPGSLTCTLGTVDASHLPELRWSGVPGSTAEIVITYRATISASASAATTIVNTATLSGTGISPLTVQANVTANAHQLFMPWINR
ncbi:MAG: PQQ-binding-like beta-propeller repeat protein [Chloroflexota bacterium]